VKDIRVEQTDQASEDGARTAAELREAPMVAQVREEDLEPHAGLRYIARLFKGLAVLIAFMLIAEIVIGLQQDGTAAIGLLLVQATRLIVFAGMLWGAGDIALMLIESNHDLRATRILLGRVNNKLDAGSGSPAGRTTERAATAPAPAAAGSPAVDRRSSPR
jgi:hypothetical protein